jgi:hypothetical protein
LRAERSNLGFKEINNFEIATSQKTLLAMTFLEFFSSLLEYKKVSKLMNTACTKRNEKGRGKKTKPVIGKNDSACPRPLQ